MSRPRLAVPILLVGLVASSGCAATPEPTPPPPVVALLTDFGLGDDAVGLMRGVILERAPRAQIVDLSHEVARFDVADGARLIAEAPGVYPAGTVFVVVVDPGVGTARRAIVARLPSGTMIVAPDNGVLTLAIERHGPAEVREVTERSLLREELSSTFHGRDVFAPVGGHLAAGVAFDAVGAVVTDWIGLELPTARVEGSAVVGEVVSIDEPFGNVWTNLTPAQLGDAGLAPGDRVRVVLGAASVDVPWVATFGDVPEGAPLLYANSRGRVALALNMADFARTHGVEPGVTVRASAAP